MLGRGEATRGVAVAETVAAVAGVDEAEGVTVALGRATGAALARAAAEAVGLALGMAVALGFGAAVGELVGFAAGENVDRGAAEAVGATVAAMETLGEANAEGDGVTCFAATGLLTFFGGASGGGVASLFIF